MAWAMPMVIVDTILLFLALQITHFGLFRPNSKEGLEVTRGTSASDTVKAVVLQKYSELGPMTIHEIQVLFWFICMVTLLFFRAPGFIPGWGNFLNAVWVECLIQNSIFIRRLSSCFAISLFAVKLNHHVRLCLFVFVYFSFPWLVSAAAIVNPKVSGNEL